MPRENGMKVCLVAISLGRGGAERSTALLSQMLALKGYDVHIVILTDLIDYPFSGKLFNLGKLKDENNSLKARLVRFHKLRQYLEEENFDFIIDNRNRFSPLKELYYLDYIYKGFKFIYVIRSANLDEYLPRDAWTVKRMIRKSYKFVGVSKHIAQTINSKFSTKKVISIYNPVTELPVVGTRDKTKYILYVGRLVDSVKNISLLLDGYRKSELPNQNIHLKIIGDGEDRNKLVEQVSDFGLSKRVEFIPFTPNVNPYFKSAFFTVLTSRYEGFPRALVESLSLGTPVISVDCVSGPKEIIQNEQNGLLVENHNAKALANAMNRMISDTELYEKCKKNSLESIAHLSMERIADQWDKLLKYEKNKTR